MPLHPELRERLETEFARTRVDKMLFPESSYLPYPEEYDGEEVSGYLQGMLDLVLKLSQDELFGQINTLYDDEQFVQYRSAVNEHDDFTQDEMAIALCDRYGEALFNLVDAINAIFMSENT